MNMNNSQATLHVEVSGPDGSGKGMLIAFLAHHLEVAGIPLVVQGATTHNKVKLEKDDAELLAKLQIKGIRVVFTEMQTFSPKPATPASEDTPLSSSVE